MKLSGYYSLMLSVGLAGKPKSDNNPEKRIQTLVRANNYRICMMEVFNFFISELT